MIVQQKMLEKSQILYVLSYPPGETFVRNIGDVNNEDIARELIKQIKADETVTLPSLRQFEDGERMWILEVFDLRGGSRKKIVPSIIDQYDDSKCQTPNAEKSKLSSGDRS